MIPKVLISGQSTESKPTSNKTYCLDTENLRVVGKVNDREALKQAIMLMLGVERYQNIIYSDNYGAEFEQLMGKPIEYALPEIERRITDALSIDSRIKAVRDFEFEFNRNMVNVTFYIDSIYGEININKEVMI